MDYEKALEKARAAYGTGAYDDATLEFLFPQLKESEEEKIIKTLQEYVKNRNWSLNGPTQDEVLEWLEKQKEQKPMVPSDEELQRHQDELYSFKVFAAKQAREHHISFVHDFEWDAFCGEILSYFNKQKPAEWSEEDSKMLDDCIMALSNWRDAVANYGHEVAPCQELIDWLKSLRPSWKPSEDEERLINTSISFLKDFADKGYENAVECIDWLKSKLNGNSGK